MVHALGEIWRVLVPGGVLIDLRPLAENWPIEVASGRSSREVGQLQDMPEGLADDEAANRAATQAEVNGWFVREQEETFSFFYYWDTPKEMEEFITEEWDGFAQVGVDTLNAAKSTWAVANADSRVRVRAKMLITRWRKR